MLVSIWSLGLCHLQLQTEADSELFQGRHVDPRVHLPVAAPASEVCDLAPQTQSKVWWNTTEENSISVQYCRTDSFLSSRWPTAFEPQLYMKVQSHSHRFTTFCCVCFRYVWRFYCQHGDFFTEHKHNLTLSDRLQKLFSLKNKKKLFVAFPTFTLCSTRAGQQDHTKYYPQAVFKKNHLKICKKITLKIIILAYWQKLS